MTVVIIEDELLSSRRLQRMLTNLQHDIVATLHSVASAVDWLQQHPHPEILFLDIQLSDGLCFDIFDRVTVDSAIIFTTAFSDYSLKAFDYKSIAYLLKPINQTQLEQAIVKTNTFLKHTTEIEALKTELSNTTSQHYKDAFAVKVGHTIKIVDTKKVCCFYSLDNATFLHVSGSNYIINHSLLHINEQLNPHQFFQVSRKCIVNKAHVKHCKRYGVNRLKITVVDFNEVDIIVSRERVKAFKAWLM